MLCIITVKRFNKIVNRRIISLSSVYNLCSADAVKIVNYSLTRRHRHNSIFHMLLLRCGLGFAVLHRHILNFKSNKFAELSGIFQHLFGSEGVNMELYYALGLESDNRVSDVGEECLERLDIEIFYVCFLILQSDEQLRAIAEGENVVFSEEVKVGCGGKKTALDKIYEEVAWTPTYD